MKAPDWRAPVFLPEDDETFVQFLGIGNALNFCFTDPKSGEKFTTEWRGQRWTGAFGMWAALRRALENGKGILDPAKLQSFTAADVARIFEPVPGSPPLPLIRERAMQLQNVGTVLAQRFGGSFARLFDACGFEAQKIVETLATFFPAYGCDRWTHPVTKEQIVFDKRARLLPLMYEGRARASESRLSTLRNIERVGPVADYEIPRALRHLDVLAYAKPLAKAIDGGILLPSGSEEELAIRHVTCLAMIALLHVVNAQRERPITMVELDYAVWSQGRKSNGRHHLTLTTAY
ncbi:MAG: hypothetical protein HY475_00610 [Candidatus Terrybacteria bacterium]|nr:hypothetical protein [Candidatus Terrybacteria bacterium]